ncbi:TPA: 30S ribosomal protein S4 [Patescibacteria group bacterium]|nr:30S ribosomal protein S4 [Candidatus Gracilibacteria bacterium]
MPGQHGANMQRSSEYGKLLRNKQVLKRTYGLSEKQFVRIVKEIAAQYSKNNQVTHDVALFQFLERRMDSVIYRSGFAKTMMQARQMVTHGHFQLNGVKHNIPSTFIKPGDKITLKQGLTNSPLYAQSLDSKVKVPSWVKIDRNGYGIELVSMPQMGEIAVNADVLKVIEFYARA